jgi:L-alanine-DL-glutamate epimerase-like enolase superfamily enzyme
VTANRLLPHSDEGFTGIKYYGWPGFGADAARDTGILRALREAAGSGVELMLDLGRPYGLSEAIRVARMIEASGADVRWWEEPLCSSDDPDSITRLVARTDLTIAAGERELTAFAFRDMIQRRTADLLQPDLSWVGGLTEGVRIAELARLHGVPMVPHNWGTMVNFAASVHLVASMPRGSLCEYPITSRAHGAPHSGQRPSPIMAELAAEPIRVEAGHAVVPQTAGLGIVLDEEAVARYTLA